MRVTELEFPGLKKIELTVRKDSRGFFVERFNEREFAAAGLPICFVQDNHARSQPGVLRGLHYQANPAQGKLVGVVRGAILDVMVDIRPESPMFGRSFVHELSDANATLLWIPGGFAHGYCVLGDQPADVHYKVDALYDAKTEGGIRWNDPDLQIPWPSGQKIVSERDMQLPGWKEYLKNPAAFAGFPPRF